MPLITLKRKRGVRLRINRRRFNPILIQKKRPAVRARVALQPTENFPTLLDHDNHDPSKQVPTKELVARIVSLAQILAEKQFYPYQIEPTARIVESLLEHDGAVITALMSRQSGKCLQRGTLVMLYSGRSIPVEQVKKGDLLMGDDSTPRTVLSTCTGVDSMWTVVPRCDYAEPYTVNQAHILSVVERKRAGRKGEAYKFLDVSVEDYLAMAPNRRANLICGYKVPVEFEEKKVDVDPYFLGLWLGDGRSNSPEICKPDKEVHDFVESYAGRLGMDFSTYRPKDKTKCVSVAIVNRGGGANELKDRLSALDLIENKHIPPSYKYTSRAVRYELFAGLIDSDGCLLTNTTAEITFCNESLARDTHWLARSLGFRAKITKRKVKCQTGAESVAWRINVYGKLWEVPTKIARKQAVKSELKENPLTYGFDLQYAGRDQYFGFVLDGNKRFLLGDFTVTHNTESLGAIVAALAIILPKLAKELTFDWKLNTTDKMGVYRGFAFGIKIGIYAPIMEQSDIMFQRVKRCLNSESGKKILKELGVVVEADNGGKVKLSNGSLVVCSSASEQSKIEGATHHLLVLEECLIGKSRISLADGNTKTIEEIVREKAKVSVLTLLNGKLVCRPVVSWSEKGVRETIILKTETREISCTPEHLVFSKEKGWVEAKNSLGLTLVSLQESLYDCRHDIDSRVYRLDDRNTSRRWIRRLPSQRLRESSLHLFSRLLPERVCFREVEDTEEFQPISAEKGSERWKGRLSFSILHQKPSYLSSSEATVLQKRTKGSPGRHSDFSNTKSNSLLVHGRRVSPERPIPAHINVSLYGRRNPEAKRRTLSELSYKSSALQNKTRASLRSSLSEYSEVYGLNPSLRHSFDDVQVNELEARKSYVRNLRESVCSLSKEGRKPVLLLEVPKREDKRLRQEKVTSIEAGKEEKVYDIGVEETHSFFAEGLLVHNCQDISDQKIRRSLHPMVAATLGTICKIGTASTRKCDFYTSINNNQRLELVTGKRNNFCYPYTVAVKYNSFYEKHIAQEKIRLGEESDEFSTSYSCLWIFERGMFVTQDQLFSKEIAMTQGPWSETYLTLPPALSRHSVVVGIDWGASYDSTFLTFGAVDWSQPFDTGFRMMNGEGHYAFYRKHVFRWVEYLGDNYEHQFNEIIALLAEVKNLKRIVTDSNTCGKPIFDRLVSVFSGSGVEIVPFNFTAKLKSDGYKDLYSDICGKRITFPAGEISRRKIEYKKFTNQMLDLRKEYKAGLMSVAHPEERGAHDDAADSLMLMNYGANSPFVGGVESFSENPFYNRN